MLRLTADLSADAACDEALVRCCVCVRACDGTRAKERGSFQSEVWSELLWQQWIGSQLLFRFVFSLIFRAFRF